MEITDELIDHLATLSKLHFDDQARGQMRDDFQRMLDFVEVLQAVDTHDVAPLIHMTEAINELRADVPTSPLSVGNLMKQAPDAIPPFFSVPKVVDKP